MSSSVRCMFLFDLVGLFMYVGFSSESMLSADTSSCNKFHHPHHYLISNRPCCHTRSYQLAASCSSTLQFQY